MWKHYSRNIIFPKWPTEIIRCLCKEALRNQVPFKEKLIYRFLKYFETCNNNVSSSTIDWDLYNAGIAKNRSKLLQLDQRLSMEAPNFNNADLLQSITKYILTVHNHIGKSQFYEVSKSLLSNRLKELNAQQLVHFMYLSAFRKTEKEAQGIVRRCLYLLGSQNIKQLPLIEKLAICDASFKTSSVITSEEALRHLSTMLYNHLDLLKDVQMFVTLVKMLRLNMCQSEELLSTISATIFFNCTYKLYDFIAICHILALYVDFLYYDKDLFDLLVNIAMKQLEDSESASYIRNKDIHRFLWICSTIGLNMQGKQLKMIAEKLLKRLERGMFKNDPGLLVDCVFYLWALNYQAECLLPFCKANMEAVRRIGASEKSSKTKRIQRLDALLVCIEIENVELYKQLKCRPQVFKFDCKVQLVERPSLHKVFMICINLAKAINLKRLKVAYQVPHINIAGVTGYFNNKRVSIEVLDETTTLKNSDLPLITGTMRLKQRLLKALGHAIIEVNHEDLSKLEHKQLEDFMKTKVILAK